MGNVFFGGGKVGMKTPSVGVPLSGFLTDTVVKINVNGTPTNARIINQGIPSGSTLYDKSCDGTWLLLDDIYAKGVWDSSNNDYENSDIHSYLNNVFYNLLDAGLQEKIKEVKVPYKKGTGASGYVDDVLCSGANGLLTKIFLLSGYELNWSKSNNAAFPIDGAALEYFKGCAAVDAKRKAYFNGTVTNWWLRSCVTDGNGLSWSVHTTGDYQNLSVGNTMGIRPAFILPSTALVEEEPNADGSVNLL